MHHILKSVAERLDVKQKLTYKRLLTSVAMFLRMTEEKWDVTSPDVTEMQAMRRRGFSKFKHIAFVLQQN